jgi:hypothetical protein
MPKHESPFKTIADLKWAYEQGYITVVEMRAINLDWARTIESDAARIWDHGTTTSKYFAEVQAEWAELDNPPVYTVGSMVCMNYNLENSVQYSGYPAKGTMGLGMVLQGNEDKSYEILVLWHVEPKLPPDVIKAAEVHRASTNVRKTSARRLCELEDFINRAPKTNFQHTESVLTLTSKARATGCHIAKWRPVPHVVF